MHKKRAVWEKHLANSQGRQTPTPPSPVGNASPTPQTQPISPPGIALPVTKAIVVTPRVITPPPISPPPPLGRVSVIQSQPPVGRVSVIQSATSPSPPSPPTMMNTPTPPLKRPVTLTETGGQPSSKKPRVIPSVFAVTGVVASNTGAGEGTSGTASSSGGASSSGASSSASAATSSHPGPATGPLGGGVVHTTASSHSIFQFLLYLAHCFTSYNEISLANFPFLQLPDIVGLVSAHNYFPAHAKNHSKGYRGYGALRAIKSLSYICYTIESKYPGTFPYREILMNMVSYNRPFYYFWVAHPFLSTSSKDLVLASLDAEEFIASRRKKHVELEKKFDKDHPEGIKDQDARTKMLRNTYQFRMQYVAKQQCLHENKQPFVVAFRLKMTQLGINHSDIT